MTSIVFSKNRAMQLHAFLRSYMAHVTPAKPVHVIYSATTPRHAASYTEVFAQFPWMSVRCCQDEKGFQSTLFNLLPPRGHVIFYVDDQVFIRPWSMVELSGLSLRLGLHLTRNYASGDTPQPLPSFHQCAYDRVTWRWSEGAIAWGYPLSVDGHMFDLFEMKPLVEGMVFDSPNTFESALQQFLPRFLDRHGTCYFQSRAVNIPWNRVQSDWDNRCGNVPVDDMLEHWEAGKQIDLSGVYGVLNESVHQEFPLVLEAR